MLFSTLGGHPQRRNHLNDDNSLDNSSHLPSELGDVDERELESSVGSMTEDQGLHSTSDDAVLPPECMGRGSTTTESEGNFAEDEESAEDDKDLDDDAMSPQAMLPALPVVVANHSFWLSNDHC